MSGVNLSLRDLLQLVASSAQDPHKVLEKAFEWRHARWLELGKWLLALASSILVAIAAATLSEKFNAASAYLYVGLAVSVACALAGVSTLLRAAVVQRENVRAAALLGDLIQIAPFLKRLRAAGLL